MPSMHAGVAAKAAHKEIPEFLVLHTIVTAFRGSRILIDNSAPLMTFPEPVAQLLGLLHLSILHHPYQR